MIWLQKGEKEGLNRECDHAGLLSMKIIFISEFGPVGYMVKELVEILALLYAIYDTVSHSVVSKKYKKNTNNGSSRRDRIMRR